MMQILYDVIVVGGGLAGATSAFTLKNDFKVLLIENEVGASGIHGALAHPLMGKKANPLYEIDKAIEHLEELLLKTNLSNCKTPIFRAAADEVQQAYFKKNASLHPHLGRYVAQSPNELFHAPFGGLLMDKGFKINLPKYIQALKKEIEIRQAKVFKFGETLSATWVELANGERIYSKKLILALGANFTDFPQTKYLNLHQVLGQIVSIKAPFSLSYALSGSGYIVQIDDRWYLGSSFDHFFTETGVSQIRTKEIIEKTQKLFKTPFKTNDILAQTGIRVTIPRSILPILNPLPDTKHTWLFTGLGAKGLLMSALIAKDIPSYIFEQLEVPKALRFR